MTTQTYITVILAIVALYSFVVIVVVRMAGYWKRLATERQSDIYLQDRTIEQLRNELRSVGIQRHNEQLEHRDTVANLRQARKELNEALAIRTFYAKRFAAVRHALNETTDSPILKPQNATKTKRNKRKK